MELKRVVVTGLGAVTPIGNNPEETWNNMLNGVSGAAPITLFDASSFKTQFACEVKNLKVNDYIDRKEEMLADYEDRMEWGRRLLVNIARSGFFSSDRTIAEYNRDIWHLK